MHLVEYLYFQYANLFEMCLPVFVCTGKYLNNYALKSSGVGVEHIPPGWDTWFGLVGNR